MFFFNKVSMALKAWFNTSELNQIMLIISDGRF